MDFKSLKVHDGVTDWKSWLKAVSPCAIALIREMNRNAIPVSTLRAILKGKGGDTPPDLPGIYGFFTLDDNEANFPLVKFGESMELFARLVSHIGVKPVKCPPRYKAEGNKFSGDSTFRVKIARAYELIEKDNWKKTTLRGEKTPLSQQINQIIDNNYRVAWQPLLFGRKDIQTWAEWDNTKAFRGEEMPQHNLQARLKPSFDNSLFAHDTGFWKKKLALNNPS